MCIRVIQFPQRSNIIFEQRVPISNILQLDDTRQYAMHAHPHILFIQIRMF